MIEAKLIQRLHLDTNVFVYAIEGEPEIADPLLRFFEVLRGRTGCAVTSELTLAEVLPKASDIHRQSYLNLIVESRIFDLQPVSRDILIETASYRRNARMPKLPDAIHAVTAMRASCQIVLSNDVRLKLPAGYTVIKANPDSLSRIAQALA